jgi:hypothetical protein
MALEAQNNPFTSILMVEAADPQTLPDADPSAGQQRLAVGTDHLLYLVNSAGTKTQVGGASGAVATDAIWDAKGDLAGGTGANTAARLTVGTDDTILMADSAQSTGLKWAASQTPSTQASGDAAAQGTADTYARGDHKHGMPTIPSGDTFYQGAAVSNFASTFTASGTSTAVTTAAFAAATPLIALVYSTGRGCNSITQTNVTWTQRYTGNGNSQWIEVWTGVVAGGAAGTTATFAFTGANKNYCEVLQVATAFTAASASITGTAATTALSAVQASGLTVGNYYLALTSANGAASSYAGLSTDGSYLAPFGGQGSGFLMRLTQTSIAYWTLTATAVNYFKAIIALT